ncbi:MAG: OB-fold nucleic acid binding domain-containing protein [Nanoarchaeota archaeon]
MEEKTLFKISLICSLLGLLILFTISDSIQIKRYDIKDITKDLEGKEIKIQGIITRISETPGLYIFDIQDETGKITAVLFKEENINLTLNSNIKAEGKIKIYKDKPELEISQITT